MTDRRPELGELMARIAADDTLRERFERDPLEVFEELGIDEIPTEFLDGVVGGARGTRLSKGIGTKGRLADLLKRKGTSTFAPPYVPVGPSKPEG